MKKCLCLFACVSLVLSSCSSSSDDPTSENGPRLKQTISTYANGSTVTSTATYDGNKMIGYVNDNGYAAAVTYTGDLITRIDYLSGGDIYRTDTFGYDGQARLSSYVKLQGNSGYKEVYQYGADGNIATSFFSGDAVSQTHPAGTGGITFQDGEVRQIVDPASTETYDYDGMKNPYKSITGFWKTTFVNGKALGIAQNITHITSGGDPEVSRTYTYRSDGYPSVMTETRNGQATTVQYVYE